jgi:hypothetical protein
VKKDFKNCKNWTVDNVNTRIALRARKEGEIEETRTSQQLGSPLLTSTHYFAVEKGRVGWDVSSPSQHMLQTQCYRRPKSPIVFAVKSDTGSVMTFLPFILRSDCRSMHNQDVL